MKKLISIFLTCILLTTPLFAETIQKPHFYKFLLGMSSLGVCINSFVQHNELINSAESDMEKAYNIFSLSKYYPNDSPDYIQWHMQHESDDLYKKAAYKKELAGIHASVSVFTLVSFLVLIIDYGSEVESYNELKQKNVKLDAYPNNLKLSYKF